MPGLLYYICLGVSWAIYYYLFSTWLMPSVSAGRRLENVEIPSAGLLCW
jgi:hypothetical protein